MSMKMSELREKDTGSLQALEKELAENLFAARLQNRSGQLENNAKLSNTRRDLARVKTVLRARELGLEVIESPAEKSAPAKKAEKPAKKEEKAPKAKEAKKSAKAAPAKAKAKTKSAAKSSAKKPAKKAGGKKK